MVVDAKDKEIVKLRIGIMLPLGLASGILIIALRRIIPSTLGLRVPDIVYAIFFLLTIQQINYWVSKKISRTKDKNM